MSVKVQRLVEYEQNNEIEVLLFADTKSEVSSDMKIDGVPKGKVISYGSSLITADGDIAFLKSDGTWNFTKSGGGSDPKLEDKSVEPDFSDGDVTVNPDAGYDALSSVTIKKDDNLVAENIKKDVEVFGITGTLEGGSGDYNAKFEFEGGEIPWFELNRQLVSMSDSTITSIGTSVFYEFENLTSVNFPNATSIGDDAFYYCSSLTSVSFPNVTSVGERAFENCYYLTSVSFPNVTSVVTNVFSYCSSLTSVDLSSATSIGEYAFDYCSSLTSINLPNVTSIGDYAFNGCENLNEVTLGSSTMCELSDVNAFSGTQFYTEYDTGTGGIIYVPAELVDTYKADPVWAELLEDVEEQPNQILPIPT